MARFRWLARDYERLLAFSILLTESSWWFTAS